MREDGVDKIEVHVAGICISDDKVLVAKRVSSRRLFPDLWECGGGQVRLGENFEDAVVRQMKEELGVEVEIVAPLSVYEILTPKNKQKKIPGLKFVCKLSEYSDGVGPRISEEHSEFRWQNVGELGELDFICGLREDIIKAYDVVKNL